MRRHSEIQRKSKIRFRNEALRNLDIPRSKILPRLRKAVDSPSAALAAERHTYYKNFLGELAYLHRGENKSAQGVERTKWRAIPKFAQDHLNKKRRIKL